MPNLYPGLLYNNKSDKYTGFIEDRNNYLVGISRFRQARVQKGMKKIQMKIKNKQEVMEVKRTYTHITRTTIQYNNTNNGSYVMRPLKILGVRKISVPDCIERQKAELRDYLCKT